MTIPFLMNGMNLTTMPRPSFFPSGLGDTDRVLVLIQLNGGNDGLNTIIPVDQYSNLFRARQNIIIPERKILLLSDTVGMHPSMIGLKDIYEDGKLGIVQNVGYPNQNRSHFRSMEIWSSSSPATKRWDTGWFGRYLDDQYPGFPESYPTAQNPDPFAISMGNYPSETCQGVGANFSVALQDPFAIRPLARGEEDGAYGPYYSDELDFLRTIIGQTNQYGEQIGRAAERGNNVMEYPESRFAQELKNVALLVSGGLQTKLYVVSLGGFDTHAGQVVEGEPLKGRHQELLQILSEGLTVFQRDIQALGLEERIIGMTFSEFGRQIRSNGSNGTDHGTAAPLILFGACVNAHIMGNNPQIDREMPPQAGVPMQYDFRDVYGSVLFDWFGLSKEQVVQFIHQDFQHLPVITGCQTTSTGSVEDSPFRLFNTPNPYQDWTEIHFTTKRTHIHLSVHDSLGRQLTVLVDKKLPQGEHSVRFDSQHLPAGTYYCRLAADSQQAVTSMVKAS